jgi:SpoVK/Ycf46/Vps4 family AAA+-type ATPase
METLGKKVPENHVALLEKFLEILVFQEKDDKRTLESFTNKFKNFVNEKDSAKVDFEVDAEFLVILQNEGTKIQELAEDLNQDKKFVNAVNEMVQSTDNALEFKSEHVILQDIIKAFNWLYPLSKKENTKSELKVKFLLAFLFEKLQGKDMIEALSIERINTFVKSEKFDENIEIIKEASLFDLGKEYENEFLLPSILKRMEHKHFSNSGAFMSRVASMIAKADGTVSEEEKKVLTKINDKLYNPKKKLKGVTQTEVNENETLADVMAELNELIGLDTIKTAVQELANFLKVQKLREAEGLKTVNNSLHSVFMGPPGTGKTTVARIVARIYKHLGYLEKGHLIETDRTGVVAGYVGQTALKVEEVVNSSLNGVLFIDEAYSLANRNKKDFGNEAVEVLLKKMEDHRDELVVIVAGYPDEMKDFIESNPGLQSRFNRYFTFDHYKPSELIGIFELFCKKNDFQVTEDAREKLTFIFDKLYEQRHKSFGNARTARNLFEKIIEYQANRIVAIPEITVEILKTITEEDIPPVNQTVEDLMRFQEAEEESEEG